MERWKFRAKPSLAVIFVDLTCFAAFALIGLHSHAEPFSAANLARAFTPFAAGWLLVSFTFGPAARPGAAGAAAVLLRAFPAWTLAWAFGLVARTLIFERPFVPAFAVVSFLFLGALLLGWRVVYALLTARRRSPPARRAFA